MTLEIAKAFQDHYPDPVSHCYGGGRLMTASLHVDNLRPTPLGTPLELRGRMKESRSRKTVVSVTLSARGQRGVRGEVVAVQVPERWTPQDRPAAARRAGRLATWAESEGSPAHACRARAGAAGLG